MSQILTGIRQADSSGQACGFSRFTRAGPDALETSRALGHNPVMTNWLRVVTIHGGLVLAGVLLFHDWLDMPSGQGLPAHFRVLAGLQALLLIFGGWVIRSSI